MYTSDIDFPLISQRLNDHDLLVCLQAALNVAYATFGAAVGNLLWGYVYDAHIDVTAVYNYAAWLLIITIALLSGSRSLINEAHFHHSHYTDGEKDSRSPSCANLDSIGNIVDK